MRTHVCCTYEILIPIEVLNLVASWSSLHQDIPGWAKDRLRHTVIW